MLEKLFIRDPSKFIRNDIAESELNNKWGSLFDVFQNADIKDNITRATPGNALLFDVVYSCINVLSDDIAKLPFKTYHRDETGSIKSINDNDVHYVLRIRPNRYMSPYTFMKLAITDLMIHGNFYALIHYDKSGKIKELLPLTSTLTHPVLNKKGDLFYQTYYEGENIVLHSDEVIHLKGMSTNGLEGMSPISAARVQLESIDVAGKYNQNMMEGGASPKGILEVQGSLGTDAKQKVRQSWERTNSGEAIGIVDNGMSYKQIGINQEDMQWLEGQKYNAQRVASLYKVPLHKINDLANATYTNIESQSLDYVKHTLQPLVTQIEYEFGFKLYTEEKQKLDYYVKFNMDSELRGDAKSRAQVNEINFRNGFKTQNEVRASNEDSPYLKDFADEPFISLNLAPAENIEMYTKNNFGKALNSPGADEPEDDGSVVDESLGMKGGEK